MIEPFGLLPPAGRESSMEAGLAGDLAPEDFAVFQKFLLDACGIHLGENKQYLMRSRLSGLLKDYRYASLGEFVAALRRGTVSAALKAQVVDAMTTRETFWFRESAHFDELKATLLPAWMAARSASPVRVWSAACSSGQEPYSISLSVAEYLAGKPSISARPVQILGTDISASALNEAARASYGDMALSRGLEPALKARYFMAEGGRWRLKPEIAGRVRFQPLNLLASYASLGRFDLIFCRNVLIYFPEAVKRDILTRLAGALNPGGFLFLSSTESMPPGVPGYAVAQGARCRYYRRA